MAPTLPVTEAAGNTSDEDVDQQLLGELACGNRLTDDLLPADPLPDDPVRDVCLTDTPLPEAPPDG